MPDLTRKCPGCGAVMSVRVPIHPPDDKPAPAPQVVTYHCMKCGHIETEAVKK